MNCQNCQYAWCWSCGQSLSSWTHKFTDGFFCKLINGFFEIKEIRNPWLRYLAYIFLPIGVLVGPIIGIVIAALWFVFGFLFFLIRALCGYGLYRNRRTTFPIYILQLILIVPVALIILVLGTIAIVIITTLYYIGLLVFGCMFMYTWCCKSRRAYVQIDDDNAFERLN